VNTEMYHLAQIVVVRGGSSIDAAGLQHTQKFWENFKYIA